MDNNIVNLIIQLALGALGGNAAGAILKNLSLGTVGNSIAGIIGGGVGGTILNMLGGQDMGPMVSSIFGGGLGGAVVMAIIGFIRQALNK